MAPAPAGRDPGLLPATRPQERRTWLDPAAALLLFAGALALYVSTLAPTVLGGDAGEFQFVPYLLGVAHPTGYPLYCLLGWAWSHLLPLGDPAFRLNLFSAVAAALASGLAYPTTLLLLRQALPELPAAPRRMAAALAAATLAATPTLWSQALIAEVYGLHTLLVVAFLYVLLVWGEHRRPRLLVLAALCFGLSLAHHRTTLLLVPAALAYAWLKGARGEGHAVSPRLFPALLAAATLPLLLYLYIPLRASHTPYLTLPLAPGRDLVLYENNLPTFLDFVLGGPFGGSLDFSVDFWARLAMAFGLLCDEVGWIGLALAVVGLIRLAIPGGQQARPALLSLTGLAYAAFVGFNLVYTIGDVYVLFIPSYVLVVLWMALGVGTLARVASLWRSWVALLPPLLLLVPLAGGLAHYHELDQSGNRQARAHWQAILSQPLPADAVLVSNDRNEIMALWYLQYVEGRRPDLLGIFPLITPEFPTLGSVLDLALDTGRPVFMTQPMPGVEVKVEVDPDPATGGLWRVLGPAARGGPEYPQNKSLADAVLLAGYDRSPRSPRPGEALLVRLHWLPLQPLQRQYHTFVHLVDAGGQAVAQSDRQPGGLFYPSTLWQAGERLVDGHTLQIPAGLAPGVYHLLAGMYTLVEDGGLESLGETVTLGPLAVKDELQTEAGEVAQIAPAEAVFGDQVELLGFDAHPGAGTLEITLHWRCLRPPEVDYTVFVHLLDAEGRIVAQGDGQPRDGTYPTSVWDAGEVVVDRHRLSLPSLPAASYVLRVGLYRPESGMRLPVASGGDSLELGPLEP